MFNFAARDCLTARCAAIRPISAPAGGANCTKRIAGGCSDKSGEQFVKTGDWNHYEIAAEGNRIRTWINGHPCVDLTDRSGVPRGIFALQLHSGDATEVRFKNLRLEPITVDQASAAGQ